MTDTLEQTNTGNHNYITGVDKFLACYEAMHVSPAPCAIAHALHNFGRSDSS